jgi:hypothetical protein
MLVTTCLTMPPLLFISRYPTFVSALYFYTPSRLSTAQQRVFLEVVRVATSHEGDLSHQSVRPGSPHRRHSSACTKRDLHMSTFSKIQEPSQFVRACRASLLVHQLMAGQLWLKTASCQLNCATRCWKETDLQKATGTHRLYCA